MKVLVVTGSSGGHIFPALAFIDALKNQAPGKGGEVWLVDGINQLKTKGPIYACEIKEGKYYDCGNVLEYLKTNIGFLTQH